MKSMITFVVLLTVFLSSGCETPGGAYVKRHPELSPQQRKIFIEKKVNNIEAVAGLTKEQIRLALGDPTQLDTVEGEEAWVFVRPKSDRPLALAGEPGTAMDTPGVSGSGMVPEAGARERIERGNVRTTIYFDGDKAVRATVANEPAAE